MWRFPQRVTCRGVRLAVPLAYAVGSVVIFGHGVVLHPGRDYVGWSVGADAQAFIWALGWWPHAILSGHNPFVTHAVVAPGGENLAWVASVPGAALALAPITLTVGPVVAYNVAALLAPALAAWTAFLLCDYLVASWPAAALGGAFFGFSPYVAGQISAGHLNLLMIFLFPVAALVIVRFVRGDLTARGLALRLGLVVAAQLLLSTELALTLSLSLVACLVCGYAAAPSLRFRVREALAPLASGYALAVIVTSPLLVYAAIGFHVKPLEPPAAYPADLLNVVVPTHPTLVSTSWARTVANSFIAGEGESGAYLGVVAVAIVGLFLWRRRATESGRFFALLLAVGLLAELGTRLYVHGHGYVPLPWRLIAAVPGFGNILPVRLSVYLSLAVAVVIALWTAAPGRHRLLRLAVAAVAVLMVLPSPRRDVWTTSPPRLAFFADALYRSCLSPGETVLLVPVPVQSYGWLWQAQASYSFRMIDGPLVESPEPPLFTMDISGRVPRGADAALLALVRARGATAIVVTGHFAFWHRLLGRHLRAARVGGAVVYPLAAAGRLCEGAPATEAAARR